MSERVFTKQQQDAIDACGGTVLVSAAAGSGKTAVLVERVINKITNKTVPCDADRFLIATFSNAAAAEMKERISAKLSELIYKNPNDAYLQKQQMLMANANISTIHSFCLNLIRSNFQKLNISMDFRIADENELYILRDDSLNEVIEAYYTEGSEDFLNLVELLSGGRDDKKLYECIQNLHRFILSHPFPDRWLEDKLKQYNPNIDVSDSPWGKIILNYAKDSLAYAKEQNKAAITLIAEDDIMTKAYYDAYLNDGLIIDELLELVCSNQWDNIIEKLHSVSYAKLGQLRKYDDEARKVKVKKVRDDIKNIINDLRDDLFCVSSIEYKEDIIDLLPKIQCLFQMVRDFNRVFSAKKREKNVADFSDLEHFALELLVDWSESGYTKTQIAHEYSERFNEILVDEYQDTNEAQDMIFKALSKNEQNLFMVGDVKQSIYRFRQAMPEIFIKQKNRFADFDGVTFPAKIILSKNFRSRNGVTNAINHIFKRIMSEQIGEIIYNSDEELCAAAFYPESETPDTSVDIIDLEDYLGEDDKTVLEARHIANRINEMIKNKQPIYDKGKERTATYKDFCILLRSTKNKAITYAKELALNGIRCITDSNGDFFEATEIKVMISMLRVINNPLLDIPLLSVLMSPLFTFSADEIAEIRLTCKNQFLYNGLTVLAEQNNEKCKRFLSIYNQLRKFAALLPADAFVNKIYDETDMLSIYSILPNAELRVLNLRRFSEYAAIYEQSGYKGLDGFIRFIDKTIEQGGSFEAASITGEQEDAVRIMSIHSSKGLEFPICFVADTAKLFNREDLKGQTLLHSELGFATVRRNHEKSVQFTTVNKEAVKLELERGMLSEELRVLYVALTRAKEKLIITMGIPNLENRLSKISASMNEDNSVSHYMVRCLNSYADWILAGIFDHKDAFVLREKIGIKSIGVGSFDLEVGIFKPLEAPNPIEGEIVGDVLPENDLVQEIQEKLKFEYPQKDILGVPAKISVSELTKMKEADISVFKDRPLFMTEEGLTATEKGTAIHTFMQFANYDNAKKNVNNELDRLYNLKYLTGEQAGSIDLEKLQAFFESNLYHRIESAEKVYRELKFFTSIKSSEYLNKSPNCDEDIIVQGIADCVFIEKGEAVLLDYKSDMVYNIKTLDQRYRGQLALYKKAIEKGLVLKVSQCIIYSFYLNDYIVLDI